MYHTSAGARVTPADLKLWREQAGLSQVLLAEALKVHPMTVSSWERGAREIPPFLNLALIGLEHQHCEK